MRNTAITALALGLSGCGFHMEPEDPKHISRSVPLDKLETARVSVKMGVGELSLSGGARQLMEGEFDYNTPSGEPEFDYRPGASRGELTIGQRDGSHSFSNAKSTWTMKLNDLVALDLDARLGVGEAAIDLSQSNLRSVSVKMGVGELELNLRGTPKRSYDIRIEGGVGEARVLLPKSVGIVATAKGGIGDISVQGLEKRGSYWYNPGHENDAVTIRVDVQGGVGEISISAQ